MKTHPTQSEYAKAYNTTPRSVRTWQSKGAPVSNIDELDAWLCHRAHIRYRYYHRDEKFLAKLRRKYPDAQTH
jgi:phage terminase Nu1 subunit (DNA packaging protein)